MSIVSYIPKIWYLLLSDIFINFFKNSKVDIKFSEICTQISVGSYFYSKLKFDSIFSYLRIDPDYIDSILMRYGEYNRHNINIGEHTWLPRWYFLVKEAIPLKWYGLYFQPNFGTFDEILLLRIFENNMILGKYCIRQQINGMFFRSISLFYSILHY